MWIEGSDAKGPPAPLPWLPESIRLFSLCDAMQWAHLPIDGGLYDQHPQLLEEFAIIFGRRAVYERNKQASQQASQGGRS